MCHTNTAAERRETENNRASFGTHSLHRSTSRRIKRLSSKVHSHDDIIRKSFRYWFIHYHNTRAGIFHCSPSLGTTLSFDSPVSTAVASSVCTVHKHTFLLWYVIFVRRYCLHLNRYSNILQHVGTLLSLRCKRKEADDSEVFKLWESGCNSTLCYLFSFLLYFKWHKTMRWEDKWEKPQQILKLDPVKMLIVAKIMTCLK